MKLCNAVLRFEKDKFVCYDLEDNHNGNHKALMFEWLGEGETQSDFPTWARGLSLLKCSVTREREQ